MAVASCSSDGAGACDGEMAELNSEGRLVLVMARLRRDQFGDVRVEVRGGLELWGDCGGESGQTCSARVAADGHVAGGAPHRGAWR